MLIDLHRPDQSGAEIKLKDIDTLTPFPAGLEYSCPSRGNWTIAHTPMIVPGSHMIYVGASACLRGVVLSAAEYEGLDRFSMVVIEEKDILSGNMEELFIEGVTDILHKLPHKPTCVLPFTGCIHYFLATDLDYIYDELHARFPDIDFMGCQMTPTMKANDHTPEEDIRRSLFSCLEPLPTNDRVVNLIGNNRATPHSADHRALLEKNGFTVYDLPEMHDYAEYRRMGEGALNLYSLPVSGWACRCLEESLGQPFLAMPYTYDAEEIERDLTKLSETLSLPLPDFTALRTRAEEALSRALAVIGTTEISIDFVSSPRFLSLAKLLLSHGFHVTALYGDSLTEEALPDLAWLKEKAPDLPLRATADFRARFSAHDETAGKKCLAIGPKVAYFTGTDHFVNMIENNAWYGFDGIVRLADAMIDAFLHEKDAKSIIQVKGWGCSA